MARLERKRTQSPPATAGRLPGDVRLMNVLAVLAAGACALGLMGAGVAWLMQSPSLTLRAIEVQGELTRNQLPTLRTHALPELAGNFFSLDLAAAQKAFESVPWVRRAVVRRIWPDRLSVFLEEHEALALWEASEGSQTGLTRLVNSFGEVFEANLGDVEDDALPFFTGPEGRATEMLGLWRRLQPAFAERGLRIERLAMSGRGSWRAELSKGVIVEMGRGSADEVVARTGRFLRTVGTMTARWRQPLVYADLRHTDGYALKLRGVGTAAPASAAGARSN